MSSPLGPGLFRIHLSTAIVLMFAAGGLLWANFSPRMIDIGPAIHSFPIPSTQIGEKLIPAQVEFDDLRMHIYEYGWPWTAYTREYGFYRESGHRPWSVSFALGNVA